MAFSGKPSSFEADRGRWRLVALLAGAVVTGLVLGVGVALLAGLRGTAEDGASGANGVPYAASREAFSEFEPPRRDGPRSALPRLTVKPGTVVVVPAPALGPGAAPPAVTPRPQKDAPADATSPVRAEQPAVPLGQRADQRADQVAALAPQATPGISGPLPTWRRNAAHVTLAAGVPRIGVVIDDLGLDRKRTERSMLLPAPVTLAFLPYGHRLVDETGRARMSGHEILVHVPMEPESAAVDPGPNVLLTTLPAPELRARLDWALTRFPGFVGINNHMGSKFTSDAAAMDLVMGELKTRGLLFLDSRTASTAVGFDRARAAGVPAALRQVFLDRDPKRAAIDHELARLEVQARKHGSAIAIGHPHDATLDALEAWLPTLAAKGLQLAPVSALVEEGAAAVATRP